MSTAETWLKENSFGKIVRSETVEGGCINNSSRLFLESGISLFLKENSNTPADMFHAEAIGLKTLGERRAIRVPQVIHAEDDFLLMEDLGQNSVSATFWIDLAEGLAELHKATSAQFGFTIDNYCGSTRQENTLSNNGHEFFATYRILKLASLAFYRKLIEIEDLAALENIAKNLSLLIPQQDAVLIHGDLWAGNIHCCKNCEPALIDPAPYWGWAEAELAMTNLFGGFSKKFYEAYESNSQIEKNWRERMPIYNIYHLLNHLLLFGTSYLAPIRNITKRYT